MNKQIIITKKTLFIYNLNNWQKILYWPITENNFKIKNHKIEE